MSVVLIAGASGLFGSHASAAFAAAGWQVRHYQRGTEMNAMGADVIVSIDADGQFNPADIRLGLLEASEGRHISTIEKLILYCYHYDPQGGKYVLVARRVMQVGGAGVATVLFSILGVLWMRELRKKARAVTSEPTIGDASDPNRGDAQTPEMGDAHTLFRGG